MSLVAAASEEGEWSDELDREMNQRVIIHIFRNVQKDLAFLLSLVLFKSLWTSSANLNVILT